MPSYYVEFFHVNGERSGERSFDCLSDSEAVYRSRCAMPVRAAAEIWCGSRSLGRLAGPLAQIESAGGDEDRHGD